MVLLAAVTLLSVTIAGAAALLEPATATSNNKPVLASNATLPAPAEQPVLLIDQTPVRVVGAPFVPNTNPRQR